jgi:hypothetical protein
MKEKWYRLGYCAGCGRDIVRRCSYRGDVGETISYVCSCRPWLECVRKMLDDNGVAVIWDEVCIV